MVSLAQYLVHMVSVLESTGERTGHGFHQGFKLLTRNQMSDFFPKLASRIEQVDSLYFLKKGFFILRRFYEL